MSERSNLTDLTRDDGSMFREYNFMLLVGDCAIRQLLLKNRSMINTPKYKGKYTLNKEHVFYIRT